MSMDASTAQGSATPAASAESQAAPVQAGSEVTSALPEPTEKKQDDLEFAKRFAHLTKREKQIIERERKVKEAESQLAEWTKSKKEAKLNPRAVVEGLGLSFKEIAEFYANDGKISTEKKLEIIEERLNAERQDAEKRAKDEALKAETQAIENHKQLIKSHIDNGGEAYELIKANDAYDAVYEVQEQYWEQYKTLLPVEQAAAQVEAFLEGEAKKLLKLKKLAAQLPPAQGNESHQDKAPDVKTPTTSITTLTHKAVAAAAAPTSSAKEYLSDEESKRRAAALIRFT